MKSKMALALAAVLATGWVLAATPKYVLLFIGDGMSVPQRMIAEQYAKQTGYGPLAMNHLPVQGTVRTSSANAIVTDSAAAATAMACGEKTNNGFVGLDSARHPLVSCAEVAHRAGRKVGILTTVTITHATPAGFYAHRENRGLTYQIGLDLVNSGFDLFAGGSVNGSDKRKDPCYKGSIYTLATNAGYRMVWNAKDFRALKPGDGKAWYVACRGEMPYEIDRDGTTPALAEMTRKAIELLDGEKGFFMMVEGGAIDHAGHANDAATNIRDTLALDEAVKVGLDFAARHADETLLLVVGDHETGGMSMGFANAGKTMNLERLASQKVSATAFEKLVKAAFKGNRHLKLDDLKPLVAEKFGLLFSGEGPMVLTKKEIADFEAAFAHDAALYLRRQKENTKYDGRRRFKLAAVCRNAISTRAGIGWSTGSHTALPVLVTATGVEAERFAGFIENTDVSRNLKALFR